MRTSHDLGPRGTHMYLPTWCTRVHTRGAHVYLGGPVGVHMVGSAEHDVMDSRRWRRIMWKDKGGRD